MIECPILVGGGGIGDGIYTTTKSAVNLDASKSITAGVYAQTGDIILATVMYRDINDMIAPDGWTLLFNSNATAIDSSLYHRFGFFTKKITFDGEVSVIFNQTASARMMLNLITIKNANDVVYRSEYTQYFSSETVNRFVDIPNKENNDTKLIWGLTSSLWASSSPYRLWQILPFDVEIFQISDYQFPPRLCNIIDLGNGSVNKSVKPSPLTTELNPFGVAAVEII